MKEQSREPDVFFSELNGRNTHKKITRSQNRGFGLFFYLKTVVDYLYIIS